MDTGLLALVIGHEVEVTQIIADYLAVSADSVSAKRVPCPLASALDRRVLHLPLEEFAAAFGDVENDAAAEARVEAEDVEAGDGSVEVGADSAAEQGEREERPGPAEVLAQRFEISRTANHHHADAHQGHADDEVTVADEVLCELVVVHGSVPLDSRDFIVNTVPRMQRRDRLRTEIEPTHYGKPQALSSERDED